MPVCVQNVDMTVRYNAHSHSVSDTNTYIHADPITQQQPHCREQ